MAKREEKQLRPARILALGFLMMIGVGTILLSLPLSSATGKALSFVDALFTATSGICVTGLIIKNTATDLSLFGKIVILILIQTGGLGYMTLSTIISLLIGKRISLKDRLLIAEAYNVLSLEGLVRFTKTIFKITIAMEFLGAFVLFSRWLPEMNPKDALFHAIFQSVSAFNNAGFSSFSDNLLPYQHDLTINLTVMTLVVMGGIGYIVISDSYRFLTGQVVKLAFHTKMVLTVTAVLIGGGSVIFYLVESANPASISALSIPQRILSSLFQAVTTRTAGFNTVDISTLTHPTLFLFILLMFVGASPGGTGGGIKTSTFGVMCTALWCTIRGQRDATAFRRKIPQESVAKSFFIAMLGMFFVIIITILILGVEKKPLLRCLFESVSAFGTVGLSTGDGGSLSLVASYSPVGKILTALLMFIGRVGPLTIGSAFIYKGGVTMYKYPEGKVLVG
ncbi:MAG: Trk family potassium uptake protein [Deltaproteobacteria bacterium]|nr:Trk family potassium uptake protein [Deltaproteobacteria bacterium]